MENEDVELGHYSRILRRNWWMIAAGVVVCVLATLLLLPSQQSFYESEVVVRLRPGDADVERLQDPISEETEVGIATSALVGLPVVEASDPPLTLEEWQDNLVVTACRDEGGIIVIDSGCDSQILTFSYQGDTAEQASDVAQRTADEYLSQRTETEVNRRNADAALIDSRLDDLEARLARERVVYDDTEEDSVEQALSEVRLRRLEERQLSLVDQRSALDANVPDVGSILSAASSPKAGSSGLPLPVGLLAAISVGGLLGFTVALLSDRLDRRVSEALEAEDDLGVPVLGDVPKIGDPTPALVTALSAHSEGAEAFRRLGAAALAPRSGYLVNSIAVTGAKDREGRTTAATNLALALARSGRPVLLVASDRRNETIDRLFDLHNTPGLNDYLRSNCDLASARHALSVAETRFGIRVLPGGTGDVEALSSGGLASLLTVAEENNMFVVFDTPPALTNSDGLQISSVADAVYVLADLGRTRRSELAELRVQLLNVQADIAGVILNRSSRSTFSSKKPRPQRSRGSKTSDAAPAALTEVSR